MTSTHSKQSSKPHYRWTLKDAVFTKDKGKVFSCFACGGGSTMGYKLAGFDVLGCNEIDPRMARAYVANHHPKYCFLEPIQDFAKRKHFPPELYDLDILDGSPPCSSFSMSGSREEKWGVKKKFREGQEEQVLDTLFFDFIELARKLQPKVVIAENVKGMLMGNARAYVERVVSEFDDAGYACQYQLLDASKMGVPQRRQRVFFIAVRKDISNVKLIVDCSHKPIPFGEIKTRNSSQEMHLKLGTQKHSMWKQKMLGERNLCQTIGRLKGKERCFDTWYTSDNRVLATIAAHSQIITWDEYRTLNDVEFKLAGAFPQDYNFAGNKIQYIIGMSVPPLMTYGVAQAVAQQILDLNRDNQATILRPAYPPRLLRNRWMQAGK